MIISNNAFFKTFSIFSEYFLFVSIVCVLAILTLVVYSAYGLILQRSLCEISALILILCSYLLLNDYLLSFSYSFGHYSLISDYLSVFARFLICIFSAMYFLFISNSLNAQKITSFEYIVIVLASVLGLLAMCVSNDLLIIYLSFELTSLSSYILASFRKTSSYSVESGVTYFIVGSVSSALFLLGSSFIYGYSGSLNLIVLFEFFGFESLFFHSFINSTFSSGYFDIYENLICSFGFLELGISLILFSLFIKLALAPFYLWSLDVYEGSPTNSTIFFAVLTKLSFCIILIRLCYVSFFSLFNCWQFYSVCAGILSVFIGSFGGLRQRKLKTLMAYSSTSHLGYAMLAFSSATFLGIKMFLFYLVIYMISSLCLWSTFLFLRLKQKNHVLRYNKELGDFALLKKSNYILAAVISLSVFSLAGIPPLVGFVSKINIFLALIKSNFYFISLITVLFSVVSTFYYIRIIKVLYFENLLVGNLYYSIKNEKIFVFSLLVFSLVGLFVNPSFVYLICCKSVLLLV